MQNRRICVIGAGPSGITALKNLLDEGLNALAVDQNHEVGGNWLFSEKESHSSVFETTHIISSKKWSEYEDFPFDEFDPSLPDYPSHEQLAAYFQAYARKFKLYEHIRFGVRVLSAVRKGEDAWELTLEQNGEQGVEHFTDLVVASGHHWNPRYPEYPGEFNGEFLHSHHFKKAEPFAGKRVLVIGGGNSACDVAVETSRVSAYTAISMRRGYRIIPKFIFGKPTDTVGSILRLFPTRMRQWSAELLVRIVNGPNRYYGMQEPDHRFGETHPTVNDELLYRIRHGKVAPKVDIERLDGDTVHFKDGTSEAFDVIIACTGFVISHPFFEKDLIDYSSGPVPLYLKMLHPEYRNLYFIGLFQPLGCIWPGAELQSRIMARELAGKWQRPADTAALAYREVEKPHYRQLDTPRHTITVDYHEFKKELQKALKR